MNDDFKKLFEFYEFLASILDETNSDLKDNDEIKNIFNSISKNQKDKELVKDWIDKYPIINSDNAINVENMSLDECIIFLKRLSSPLSDYLMEVAINSVYDNLIIDIKTENPFLYKNFHKFLFLTMYHTKNSDIWKNCYVDNIPFMSFEETTKIVSDFFSFIDPSGKVKKSFNDYLKSGNIYVWNKSDNKIPDIVQKEIVPNIHYEWFFAHDSISNYINAPLDNNLADSISLVHEFFHYYIPKCDYGDNEILKEFPSIFFETVFAKYLINLGYNEKLLNGILFFRIGNHVNSLRLLSEVNRLIRKKENKKDIKIDDFVELIDEEWVINNFPEKHLDEFLRYVREVNAEAQKTAREKMAEQINKLDCNFISVVLSYLLGKCFTDKILERENDIVEVSRKVLAVKDTIKNQDMSFHYLLAYFELWDYYYILEQNDFNNNTIPKRIEDKQLIKK